MFRPLSLFIGLRYNRAKTKNNFISFISFVSILGLALGVFTLIVVLSVMNGFDHELQHRILGMVPQATITTLDRNHTIGNWQELAHRVKKIKGISAIAPFNDSQGMITFGGNVHAAMLFGVLPKEEKKVSILSHNIVAGSLADLRANKFGIVLGSLLAQYLGVQVGDKVTVMLPDATINPAGIFPRIKRFTVVGVFSVGANIDSSLAYIHLTDSAKILRINQGVKGLRLKLDNLYAAPQIGGQLFRQLPGDYMYTDWTQTQGKLFQAIKMEKTMVGLLLTLIIAVAAFNIVATLVMVVTDKQADIAILRTMGVSSATIMKIFIVQGTFIGIIGSALGAILGIIGAWNVSGIVAWIQKILKVQFLNPNVYFISYLPSQLQWSDVAMITLSAILMGFLATIYPSWQATRIKPVEVLRYE